MVGEYINYYTGIGTSRMLCGKEDPPETTNSACIYFHGYIYRVLGMYAEVTHCKAGSWIECGR